MDGSITISEFDGAVRREAIISTPRANQWEVVVRIVPAVRANETGFRVFAETHLPCDSFDHASRVADAINNIRPE